MKELLEENPNHITDRRDNEDYAHKNKLLHAILMHCTSEGLALHQVKKFESLSDGYLAY